jgi:hypothetical protein
MKKQEVIKPKQLRKNARRILVLDERGKCVGVIRISLLHLGTISNNTVEIRTETEHGETEARIII